MSDQPAQIVRDLAEERTKIPGESAPPPTTSSKQQNIQQAQLLQKRKQRERYDYEKIARLEAEIRAITEKREKEYRERLQQEEEKQQKEKLKTQQKRKTLPRIFRAENRAAKPKE